MSAERDRELQGYLEGGSPLSAKYREQSKETAPPELDAAVLDFARGELKKQAPAVAARGRAVRRSRRWTVPLATAATMLLGLNLVWQLRDQALPAAEQAAPSAPQAPAATIAEDQASPRAKADSAPEKTRRLAADAFEMPAERSALAPAAPAPATMQDLDASAPADQAMAGAAPEFAPAPQAAIAETMSEPAAKEEQVRMQAARSAEREAQRQSESRADSAKLRRERKYSAAAGLAAAPARVQAYVPVPPASEVANQVMDWLRKDDFAAIRSQLLAKQLDQEMLVAAAAVAKSIDPTTEPEFSSAGEDLWRVDYRAHAQRCTMMLERTPGGWMLLRVDIAGE